MYDVIDFVSSLPMKYLSKKKPLSLQNTLVQKCYSTHEQWINACVPRVD